MKEGVEKSAPSFGRALGDVECDEGQKLRITTPVKGNPIPEFSWTKDGKPLSGERVHAFSDGELVSSFFVHYLLLSIGEISIICDVSISNYCHLFLLKS